MRRYLRFITLAIGTAIVSVCCLACSAGSDADGSSPSADTVNIAELSVLPTPSPNVTLAPLPTPTVTPTPTPIPVPTLTPEPTPTPKAVMQFVGDIMCLKAQQKIAKTKSGYDFSPSFERVQSILAGADCTVGNLETVIDDAIPYTLEAASSEGGTPYCNAPSSFLDAVKEAGFDALITANNHCCDCGESGILSTLDALDARDIPHTGTFRGEEDRFLLLELNGIKVAILANTATVNGKQTSLSEGKQDSMLSLYTAAAAKRDIAAAKSAGAEFIIVYMHGGTENSHTVTARQTTRAQELADAGADLIIGSHPHVLQKAVTLTAADGRTVPCFYSLGNFLSSMNNDENRDAAILRVELTRTESGIAITDMGYIGVLTMLQNDRLIITPVSPGLNGNMTDKALSQAQSRIAKRLGNEITEITE